MASTQPAAKWMEIPDSVLTPVDAKLSIARGAIAGVTVDRTNGDVYFLLRNKKGVVKSEDQGATVKDFKPEFGGQGAMYTASISVAPGGKRVAIFTIYGPGGMSLDAGKT